MFRLRKVGLESGFTIIELVIATVITPIVIIGLTNAIVALRSSYATTRQINEILSVAATYPELDRGLRYESLANAYSYQPTVLVSNESGTYLQYTPTITVQDSTSVPETSTIQNSKVVDVTTNYNLPNGTVIPVQLRLLIARNGIGQL